jgi:2-polyprenyl-3-methyl-5-hydroxy-6-metoxy-1,4-benzoquinol methylase
MAMKPEARKDFDKEAAQWDANPGRVKLACDVAAAIIREVNPSGNMEVVDFGCGTGLLTLKLQPLVRMITGVDNSQGMLGMLQKKIKSQGLTNVHTQFVDFEKGGHVEGSYNLIVSSMTLHHVPDTVTLFKEWFSLLRPNGQVCFADLDTEDGSFHGDNTGVFHLGFDRDKLKQLLHDAGFCDVRDTTATTMIKEIAGQGTHEYPVFLIIATRKVKSKSSVIRSTADGHIQH